MLNRINIEVKQIKFNLTIPRINFNISQAIKEVSKLDLSFLIIFSMTTVSTMGFGIINQYLPIIISEQFNSSVIQVGYILTIKKLSQIVLTPFSGRLSDRFGRLPLIIIGFSIYTLFGFLSFNISNILNLTLILIGMSIGTAITGPVILALLTDISPANSRGTIIGMLGAFQDLGILISPTIASFIWGSYSPMFIFPTAGLIQIISLILAILLRSRFKTIENNA
jgi:MFS family permease